jgi:signal transduction histidine kinase
VLSAGKWKTLVTVVAVWVISGLAYLYYTAVTQRALIETELERETGTLHRIVSQRADQHDAHLTSLSALAISEETPQIDLVLQVAGAIQRFYPRVTEIDLVSLRPDLPSISTRTSSDDVTEIRSVGRAAAARSSGKFELLPSPVSAGRYLIVKRSPNTDAARFGLTIEVDARALAKTESPFWKKPGASVALSLPDESLLFGESIEGLSRAADSVFTRSLVTQRELGSRTQPLILTTRFVYGAGDLFPVEQVAIGLVTIGTILAALVLVIKLASKTRSAEQRARLGEQDARIAHASRVNALGEIASGMAHELNQPLTAILSQSQAGVRLLARHDTDPVAIERILKSNITQSKRAADIIVRLREWTSTTPPVSVPQNVNRCIENVVFLLGPDCRRQGIGVTVQTDPAGPEVSGDSVEIEQVLFNLVRNAMEALEQSSKEVKTIRVSSLISDQQVVLAVTDNGPGIDPEMRERLFEPFVTGKKKGMGLGLVLCERIVERMGGNIDIQDTLDGGVTAQIRLPLVPSKAQ